MKRMSAALIGIVCLLLFSACQSNDESTTISSTHKQTDNTTEAVKKTAVPSLFIHGYKGTVNSFGGMIKRLESQQLAQKELVMTVLPDGSLQTDGSLSQRENNPIVQVLFTDNKNNEWNQAEWIYGVLRYLKSQGVNQVNVVGHSMGGVSLLRYVSTYGQPADAANIAKLIAIGSPFNDFTDTSEEQSLDDLLENGPTMKSNRYIDYETGLNNTPAEMPIVLLAGQLSDNVLNDGTVPTTSALSVYALLKQHGNPVEKQILTGPNAQHSQLHENRVVDQKIADELWGRQN